ncbi:hypothetical protein FQN54_002462 [Arachnomyces sp. PD_36]|nr:hypothetical protein FQN54_002462 [Arachnomyces sp. PD_36]
MGLHAKLFSMPDSKEERRLVLKLDWFILSFCCLILDRANINNAYVSGMKEDLGMYDKELNEINTIFYGGYVFGQIPTNLALQKVPPRIYFPAMMLVWGLFTLGTAFVNNPQQVMVIRFFQAVAEASTFVGVQYILGSWYKREELGKRTAIFTSSGLAGSFFSGFLQGGIHSTLDGRHGFAGWRWLFVIDFLITLPVAIYGFFGFPDVPSSSQARYLSPAEKQLAITRLPPVKNQRGTSLDASLLRRVLCSWELYIFVPMWIFGSNTEMYSTNAIMSLLLKWKGTYTVEEINYIPTGTWAVGIVATLALGWYSDLTKSRWHVGILLSLTAIISGSIMLSPPSFTAQLVALFLNGFQYAGQTVFLAWANDRCYADDPKRGVVLAAMQTGSIAVFMFWSILFYNTMQVPEWRSGSIAMVCMGVALLGSVGVAVWLERRDDARVEGRVDGSDGVVESGSGEEKEKT